MIEYESNNKAIQEECVKIISRAVRHIPNTKAKSLSVRRDIEALEEFHRVVEEGILDA